jgi:hypothetical protein
MMMITIEGWNESRAPLRIPGYSLHSVHHHHDAHYIDAHTSMHTHEPCLSALRPQTSNLEGDKAKHSLSAKHTGLSTRSARIYLFGLSDLTVNTTQRLLASCSSSNCSTTISGALASLTSVLLLVHSPLNAACTVQTSPL